MVELPVSADQLASLLNRPLAPRRDGLELDVRSARITDENKRICLIVEVAASSDRQALQRWSVNIPLGRTDEQPSLAEETPEAFIVTCRANLEEWWDVKNNEPTIGAWGSRID